MSSATPSPSSEETRTAKAAAAAPRSRRRRWKIAAWIVIPLVILGLIVFVLPTYAARYIVSNQLEGMGIDSEGVDTLRIDVWNREIWLGPVLFRGEEAPFGEVEEVGLKFGVVNLFQRQALVRTLIIKGVDVQVTREANGNIVINGVDLSRIVQPKDAPPSEQEDEPGWGAGLDDFRFVDSRIFFTDRTRGTITLDVDSLELHEFRTWQPDHPGRFILDARVNNMGFRAQGTARPFGEVIQADIEMTIDDVELEKIAEYTGPLGFERRSGILAADLTGQVEADTAQGSVDARIKGEIVQTGVDANRPEEFAIAFDRAVLKLDNRYRLAPDGAATASGPLNLSFDNARFDIAGGTTLSLGNGTLDVPALTVDQAEGRTQVASKVAVALAEVEAQPAAADGQPAPSITVGTIKTDLNDIEARLGDGATAVAGGLDLVLAKVEAQLPQPGAAEAQRIAADEITLSLPSLAVETGAEGPKLAASGATGLTAFSAAVPAAGGKPPVDAGIQSLKVNLSQVTAAFGGELQWAVAFDAVVEAVNAAVAGGDLAQASLARMTMTGAQADQAMALGAEEITLGATNVAFKRDVLTAFAGEPEADAAEGTAEAKAGDTASGGPGGDGGGSEPSVRVGSFSLSSPLQIAFTDTTVTPEVNLNTNVTTLQIEDLDMAQPEQKTDLRLAAVVNDFTDIVANGWIAPFGAKADFSILAQIQKLELPPLSPYAAQAVGANIDSGRLTLKADAAADNGQLDGLILIDLRNLEFGALSEEDAERLSESIGVPIGTVVGLLQDSEGKIDLRIPISGDLGSPNFDLSNTIAQAVTGAVAGAVTAPFKLLFQPVGALASAVGGGGPSFRPIPFAPGDAALGPEARVFTDNLAKMLRERPKLSLQVCGKAASEDLQALRTRGELPQSAAAPAQGQAASPPAIDDQARSALTRLAEERTRAVRQQLVERDDIGPGQVAECRAAFEPDSKLGPRAEISF